MSADRVRILWPADSPRSPPRPASVLPVGEAQRGHRSCPGMSRLPKASAGTVAGIQEVAMATAGLRAISCNQCWDPATRWASWRFVPSDGRLRKEGFEPPAPLGCPPLPHPTWQGCQAGTAAVVFGRELSWTGSRDWSSHLE